MDLTEIERARTGVQGPLLMGDGFLDRRVDEGFTAATGVEIADRATRVATT